MKLSVEQELIKAKYQYPATCTTYDKGKASQEKIDALVKETGSNGKWLYEQFMLMQ